MTDIIVILVIAVFVLLGVKSTIKHFKGEGACCGGGGGSLPPEEKKLENPVIGKKIVKIPGMRSPKPSTRLTAHPQKSACTEKKP